MIETETAIQHSSLLTTHIMSIIADNGGKITFAEYMHQALYAPSLGYYNAGAIKFGAAGDFITAPELGCLFAQSLARQCEQILAVLPQRNILELGAGSGRLAGDLLQHMQIDAYYILELSADLRQRQQDLIKKQYPNCVNKIHWLDKLPENPFVGVIIANEVMDAMPVTRFHFANDTLQECYVTVTDARFVETLGIPTPQLQTTFANTNLAKYISQPYTSEINAWLTPWINSLQECLATGAIILCDYGFPRAEYYHPQRNNGTLMCHYKHRCHADPLIYVGLQDITAHVDFTAVAEAASACNLEVAGYTNLASFLLNCEITKFLLAGSIRQAQELQTLTSPSEMGELFKVIALTKNLEVELLGFENLDKRHTL